MTDMQNQLKNIQDLLGRFKSGIIALQANPSYDGVAAATGLYLALTKMGKHMSIVCATKPQHDLVGVDKIQQGLSAGGNHLVISFPYREGTIDKVDYNIASNTFNLIIIPNSDTEKINPQDVKFSYTGGKVDFIITVDVPNLNSLGALYSENQAEFQGKNIINIDRHLINNNFGTVNIVNKSISSTSELVLNVMEGLNIQIDKDIATNIYNGMLAATNNFSSYSVNPTTFESAAKLMKQGAVKKQLPQAQGAGMPTPMPPRPQNPSPFGGFGGASAMSTPAPVNSPMPMDYEDDFEPIPLGGMPPMRQHQNPMQPMPQPPMQRPNPPMQQQQPMGQPQPMQHQHNGQQLPPQPNQQNGQQQQQPPKSPQDWLKPKLFGGNNLV